MSHYILKKKYSRKTSVRALNNFREVEIQQDLLFLQFVLATFDDLNRGFQKGSNF